MHWRPGQEGIDGLSRGRFAEDRQRDLLEDLFRDVLIAGKGEDEAQKRLPILEKIQGQLRLRHGPPSSFIGRRTPKG